MRQSICVKLNDNGFFVNFIQVMDWVAFGIAHDIPVGVDWRIERRGPGWDFNYGGPDPNIWNNYFEPLPCTEPVTLTVAHPWTRYFGGFRGFRLYRRLDRGDGWTTLAPLHQALAVHVRLRPQLQQRIDAFASAFAGRTAIGVHLRNPVGSRGFYSRSPTMDRIAREVEKIAAGLAPGSDWFIFAASDREGMIESLAERFPGRVLWQHAVTRAPEDAAYEVHAVSEPSYELGVDAISDCWLLARCDHLVGIQSSVCLAACIINPALRFHHAITPGVRALAAAEYGLKAAWCGLFERLPDQVLAARALASRASISASNRPK